MIILYCKPKLLLYTLLQYLYFYLEVWIQLVWSLLIFRLLYIHLHFWIYTCNNVFGRHLHHEKGLIKIGNGKWNTRKHYNDLQKNIVEKVLIWLQLWWYLKQTCVLQTWEFCPRVLEAQFGIFNGSSFTRLSNW